MSQEIKVRVCRGQTLVTEVDRPLRVFAGVPAVKFHRKLWPLLPGNRIDIHEAPLQGPVNTLEDGGSTVMDGAVPGEHLSLPAEERSSADSGASIVAFIREIEQELE